MGWNNPPIPWKELESVLSGKTEGPLSFGQDSSSDVRDVPDISEKNVPLGRDHPLWTPYAELHCHSNFSFLDGANHPEDFIQQAHILGLEALAITDHNGMYGAVRFAEAAKEFPVRTVFGTELSLGVSRPQNGIPDPEGEHLLLLAKGQPGYASLCRAITQGQLWGYDGADTGRKAEKGAPVYNVKTVAQEVAGDCVVLTGCRKGAVRRALREKAPALAFAKLRDLVELFGEDSVYVELIDHGNPEDSTINDLLVQMAVELKLPTLATNAVHYSVPEQSGVADAVAAIRARRGISEMEGWLPAAGMAFLCSGAQMVEKFAHYPGVVRRAAELGRDCAFDLDLIRPNLPPFTLENGHTEESFLREQVYLGAKERYQGKDAEEGHRQLEHELRIIEKEQFPGYFLIVWDIVRFCKENNILCQGRGSAANSAVCYALGITKVDPVKWKLLFERFLAPERDGYPDIDLDIESDRREEVIQYVYRKHGRLRAAQVANVITYRGRSAIRDAAKALGYAPGQQDSWGKQVDRWGPLRTTMGGAREQDHDIPKSVLDLAAELEGFPRHLGIHSGGMVLADRPVSEVCPIEWARMADRSVLQWEKDDCATAGLVKFDLLGLGMLSALHYMLDLVREQENTVIDLAQLNLEDEAIYEMLCQGDAVGVFQVESRAQLATLPRLKPRKFYDLAVEVALIRPGPIQGNSVHPYIRRANKQEKWEHDHPLLKNALDKTYGVPLFQEQMMRIAIDVASFTTTQADELRHAMGSKRSQKKMAALKQRFCLGAQRNGVPADIAEKIFHKLEAFANFGFPESHALSFAYLVFASAYFKRYHPAAFCAALLRAQPMGFYSPQSLVADARRHGVVVLGPDVNASFPHPSLEPHGEKGKPAVRNGLSTVRAVGQGLAEKIVEERNTSGVFADLSDLARRVRMSKSQWEALATSGAFACFNADRRATLWSVGAAAEERPEKIPGSVVGLRAPTLPGMDEIDIAAADVWATGISPDSFPTQFIRDRLTALGVVPANGLTEIEQGTRVLVGGAVTHRQRPTTANGVTFITLEDETGMVNVICTEGLWRRYQRIARSSSALLIRGIVEHSEGVVVNILADRLQHLPMRIASRSRDFR